MILGALADPARGHITNTRLTVPHSVHTVCAPNDSSVSLPHVKHGILHLCNWFEVIGSGPGSEPVGLPRLKTLPGQFRFESGCSVCPAAGTRTGPSTIRTPAAMDLLLRYANSGLSMSSACFCIERGPCVILRVEGGLEPGPSATPGTGLRNATEPSVCSQQLQTAQPGVGQQRGCKHMGEQQPSRGEQIR